MIHCELLLRLQHILLLLLLATAATIVAAAVSTTVTISTAASLLDSLPTVNLVKLIDNEGSLFATDYAFWYMHLGFNVYQQMK